MTKICGTNSSKHWESDVTLADVTFFEPGFKLFRQFVPDFFIRIGRNSIRLIWAVTYLASNVIWAADVTAVYNETAIPNHDVHTYSNYSFAHIKTYGPICDQKKI